MSNFIEKKRRKSFLPCQYYQRFKSYNCKNKDRKKREGGGGEFITFQSGNNKILYVIIYFFSYKQVYCNKNLKII